MDWEAVCASARPPLEYRSVNQLPVVCHGGVDVTSILKMPETKSVKADARLPLTAMA
jgi:hypothetical protein